MNRMMAIVEREMRKFFRSPMLMIMSLMMPILQLIIMGNAFGGKIVGARVAVVDYDHGPDTATLLRESSPQPAAQHPNQENRQEADNSKQDIERVLVNESVEGVQCRHFQFQGFALPRLHDVLLMRQRLALRVRGCGL